MDQRAETKLSELRCKTNRQLVSLISHKLDRGLAFARALERDGGEGWASTERFAANAEQALADASAWMPLIHGTSIERPRLDLKLAQLRDALNRLRESEVRARAAC
jgi:hypothetical protein